MRLYIGLMSGTSMDGIDAALIDLDTHTLIAGIIRPYSQLARETLMEVLSAEGIGLGRLNQLNSLLGKEFAAAAQQLMDENNIHAKDVIAIGSHGQTICHDATNAIPYTVQLGCGHTIAELTGITVVADFRTRDMVLGGRGAPFAPIYHEALFAKQGKSLALVNIGGIANVTFIAPGITTLGYDTGPGNCLMDAWVQSHLRQSFDASGEWAKTGSVVKSLLGTLLADPFFQLPSPKSIGKEYFSLDWLSRAVKQSQLVEDGSVKPCDIQATLLELTATTIANEIKEFSSTLNAVLICGGGVHNKALFERLSVHLPDLPIDSTAEWGVSPDYLEAMLFAWLADKAVNRIPLDLSRITGSSRPAILGVLYPVS